MGLARKAIFVGLTVIVAAAVAAAAAEVLVRLLVPSGSVATWLVRDPVYGYIQRPGVRQVWHYAGTDVTWRIRINSLGMRGPECDLRRRDRQRLLLLGDSFTFGYGLDEDLTFAGQLRRMLNQERRRWCVLNAGVGGWGTVQEVKYAIRNLEKLQPDVIVLTFCPNDQVDDIVFLQGAAGGLLPYFPGKRFLRDHSRLYGFIYSCLHTALFNRVLLKDLKNGEERPGKSQAGGPRAQPGITPQEEMRRWERTGWYIRMLHERFLTFNPDGLLILQTTHPWRQDLKARLSSLCKDTGMVYVDLEDDARRIGRGRIFLSYDPHWSAAMHEASAQRLLEVIRGHYRAGFGGEPAGLEENTHEAG